MVAVYLILLIIVSQVKLGTTLPPSYSPKQDAAPSPITKNTIGNRYENAFFGLSIEKPKNWYSQNPEETMQMAKGLGAALLANNDGFQKTLIEEAMEKAIPLFTFFKYPLGTPGKINPNIVSIAENIKLYTGVKTGCDYLTNSKEALKMTALKINFLNKCHEVDINGEKFGTHALTIKIPGQPLITQNHYAKITKNGYAILVSLTSFNSGSKRKLETILRTLKFSK